MRKFSNYEKNYIRTVVILYKDYFPKAKFKIIKEKGTPWYRLHVTIRGANRKLGCNAYNVSYYIKPLEWACLRIIHDDISTIRKLMISGE